MKVWVAGCRGMLGQAFVDADLKTSDLDVTDFEAMQRFVDKEQPTHLINCTAFTDVDGAEKNKAQAFAVNAQAVENMGRLGIKVIHFSTDYVFDGKKGEPYSERDKPCPINVYGESKLEGEKRLLDIAPNSLVIRISWLYGDPKKDFIGKMARQMALKGEISVVDDQVGRVTFSEDVVSWVSALMGESGIWHGANMGTLTRYEWMKALFPDGIVKPVKSETFSTPAQRPKYSVLSTQKLEKKGVIPRDWKEVLCVCS